MISYQTTRTILAVQMMVVLDFMTKSIEIKYLKISAKLITSILVGGILTLICMLVYFKSEQGTGNLDLDFNGQLVWFDFVSYTTWILFAILTNFTLNRLVK